MNKIIKKEIEFAGKKLSFETGQMAMQTNMSVKATFGDTVMLVTAVSGGYNPDLDFFPLMVNYSQKLYASGTIKSSRFMKRDFRGTDDTTITQRLADHAIRPLFPSDFKDEVQVAASVISLDEEADADFLFMNAISACLMASDIPWNGPSASIRVAMIDGEYVAVPAREKLHHDSSLDMMVSFAGDDKKFLAVEAEAGIVPENKILGAMEFGRNQLDPVLQLIKDFAAEVNPEAKKYEYESQKLDEEIVNEVNAIAKDKVIELMQSGADKLEMKAGLESVFEEVFEALEGKYKKSAMEEAFADIERLALQHMILTDKKRPDGRGITEVRPISVDVGLLPRTHGSGLFTRGVTQVMTVATLGAPDEEEIQQDIYGESKKRYMHHYNFPPFSVGEVGRIGGYPKNREIGHGLLAEKALVPVLPSKEEFPYAMLLVSETLSSSGSSSMAATCGSTLALMDAGVPIKDMVAGVGVGLIVNDDMSERLIMTDLAYMEDAFGFLDFKMTGTKDGVTAIQCDMKAEGIPMDLLPKIVEQSKEGRLHVLAEMQKVIDAPRTEVSDYAPKMVQTKIDPSKIGMVIGSGGKTITEIQERTGANISIDDDGTIVASSVNKEAALKAIEIVEGIVKEVEVGEIYEGEVKEIVSFGAFVEVLPGKEGLLHVSEISNEFIKNVEDHISVGDVVKVKVIKTEDNGKFSLSKKALEPQPAGGNSRDRGGSRDNGTRDRKPRGDKKFRR